MRTRKSRWLWIAIIGMILATLLAACGDDDDGNDNGDATEPTATTDTAADMNNGGDNMDAAMTVEVSMVDNAFEPQEVTITPGTTVVWTNNGQVPHTVTAGDRDNPSGVFDSGNIEPGDTFEYTFPVEGIFSYYCSLHPGMDGTVTVASG